MLIRRSILPTRFQPLACTLALTAVVLGGCGGGEGGDSTDSAASPPGGKPGQSTDSTQRLETLQEPVIAPVLDDEPPLELVPPVLDFGVVAPNATSQGAVRLFNRSEEPMLILAVEPSCKCTALDDIAGRTIAPGESIELNAVLDASPNIGPKNASIKILVDGYPVVKLLNIKAQISLPVRPIPALINAVRGQNRQGRIIVESIDDQPFSICSFHGDSPTYLGFDPTSDEPRSKYVLTYDLDAIAEPYPRYLVIETDRPDVPVVDVYLRHESTLPKINRRLMMSGGYRFPIGRIEQGQSTEIEIPFNSPASPISTMISLLPGVRVDLMGTRDEETADGIITNALVKITPAADFKGLLYAPLEAMSATGDVAGFDVFGVVVPSGDSCAGPNGG